MPNMKISFLIPAIVFYVVRVAFSSPIQVGTVLFTTADLVKKCWTESDKSLLKARLIMQDVLPNPDCIDFSKPKSVTILLDYFRSCYEIVTAATCGEMQNIMILALSDALGGYLRGFILPQTKGAFYAGEIRYTEANKLFKLYDDLRLFLRTNGVGWAKPQKLNIARHIMKPMVFSNQEDADACRQMYIIEKLVPKRLPKTEERVPEKLVKENKDSAGESPKREARSTVTDFESVNPIFEDYQFLNLSSQGKEPDYNERRYKDGNFSERLQHFLQLQKNMTNHEQRVLKNVFDMFEEKEKKKQVEGGRKRRDECPNPQAEKECAKKIIIPLPVIDDCVSPHTIAVPFRKKALRSLHTRTSAYIVKRYYSAAIKCLVSKCKSKREVKSFNAQFYNWLTTSVFPHLNDEKWYPGFGSILRVMETIKQFGTENYKKDPVYHDIAFLFSDGFEFEDCNSGASSGRNKFSKKSNNHSISRTPSKETREVVENDFGEPPKNKIYVVALAAVGGAWLVTCLICILILKAKKKVQEACESEYGQDGKKKANFLNLHFIVKFFKRSEKNNDSETYFMSMTRDPYKVKDDKKNIKPEVDKNKTKKDDVKPKKPETQAPKKSIVAKPKEKDNVRPSTGQGKNTPFSCQAPYIQHHQVLKDPNVTFPFETSERNTKDQQHVKMIWKKPAMDWRRQAVLKEFEDQSKNDSTTTTTIATASVLQSEDYTKSTESQTKSTTTADEQTKSTSTKKSSCSCSGSCSHTAGTTTATSSRTQADENFSSTSTFNLLPAKSKRNFLSSTEETTESESEDESCSSQTED